MIFTKGAPAVGTIGTTTSGSKLKQAHESESKAHSQAGVRRRRSAASSSERRQAKTEGLSPEHAATGGRAGEASTPAQLKGRKRYSSRGVGAHRAPTPTPRNAGQPIHHGERVTISRVSQSREYVRVIGTLNSKAGRVTVISNF